MSIEKVINMTKKICKLLTVVLILMVAVFATGCNEDKEKEKFATKVTDRYARYLSGDVKTPFLYDDLVAQANEKFGQTNYGSVINTEQKAATGILYWVDGDYTTVEILQMISDNKHFKGLAISFSLGLAVDAYYGDLEGWLY